MKKNPGIIVLVLALFYNFGLGQVNIVPNPSFEFTNSCPTGGAQWNRCTNWNNVNLTLGPGAWGTPDYFHSCGTGGTAPPATFGGTCNPQSGVAMMALVCYNNPFPNYREYLSAQLTCTMQPGFTYTLSFWLTNGTGIISPWVIKNIGAHFSTTPLTQTGWNPIPVIPQCEITTSIASTTWVQYTFTVVPTAAWQYITVGAFRPDASNAPTMFYPNPGGNPSVYANYFIDNIQVLAPATSNFSLGSTINQTNPCGGTSNVTLLPSITATNINYNWSSGGYNTPVVNNIIPGAYTVIATAPGACGNSTASTQFTVNQFPALNVNLNSLTLCKNQTGQLTPTVTGGTPSFNYTWQPGNITAPAINVNAQNFTYTLSVRDANNCLATAISQVNYSQVNAAFNYNLNPCNGFLNTSNTSFGATSFNWSFGDNSVSTQTNTQHTYSSSGNYSVQLIASNANNCKDTVTKLINVPVIVKSAFTAHLPVCDSVVALTNSSTGANSYLWRFGDGKTQTVSTGGALTHTYASAGNYTIWLVAINSSGCRDSVSYGVVCSKNSLADFDTGLNTCSRTINFKNTSKWNQTNFWSFGTGITSTSVQPVYTYTSNGIYTVSLLINAGSSCSASITKSVEVTDTPDPSLNYITSPCNGLVTFSNTTTNSGSVIWTFGDGSFSTLNGPAHTYTRSGVYPVILTIAANQPCRKSATISVAVNFTPAIADFDFKTEGYSSSVNFINKSKNTNVWYWDFNDGTNSTLFEPAKTFGDYGTKLVCLVAGNDKSCADTLCKYILVENDWTLYVPNVFSPNGDGINDVFYAYGTNIKNYWIKIFNRWGQMIFESGEFQKGWDGTYKAQLVQEDIYTWMIEFADLKGKNHSATGHVSVVR